MAALIVAFAAVAFASGQTITARLERYEVITSRCFEEPVRTVIPQPSVTINEPNLCNQIGVAGTVVASFPGSIEGTIVSTPDGDYLPVVPGIFSIALTADVTTRSFDEPMIFGVSAQGGTEPLGCQESVSAEQTVPASSTNRLTSSISYPCDKIQVYPDSRQILLTTTSNIQTRIGRPSTAYISHVITAYYVWDVVEGPKVDSLDQKIAARGSPLRLNIRGQRFAAGAVPAFLKGDGSVDPELVISDVNVVSSTEIRADLFVNPDAVIGPRTLRVTSAEGSGTKANALNVIDFDFAFRQGTNSTLTEDRVANHPTVVRVRVVNSTNGGLIGMTGRLYVFNGDAQIPGSPFTPDYPQPNILSDSGQAILSDQLSPQPSYTIEDRFGMRDSLNFYFGTEGSRGKLPQGHFTFALVVDPVNPHNLPPPLAQTLSRAEVKAHRELLFFEELTVQDFLTTNPLRILTIVDPRLDEAQADTLYNRNERAFQFLRAAFPVDGPTVELLRGRFPKESLDLDSLSSFSTWLGTIKIIRKLGQIITESNKNMPEGFRPYDRIVLLIEQSTAHDLIEASGVTMPDYDNRAAIVGGRRPFVLAHELGHTFGLFDTYPLGFLASIGSPNPRRSDATPNGNQVEDGVERLAPVLQGDELRPVLGVFACVASPAEVTPFVKLQNTSVMGSFALSNFNNAWPDRVEWNYLWKKVRVPAQGAQRALRSSPLNGVAAAISEYLVVRGAVDAADQVDEVIVTRGSDAEGANSSGSGDFTLELLDSSGQVISSRSFSPNFIQPHAGLLPAAPFNAAVPFVPGAVQVQIRKGGAVLFSRAISPNPPSVQLLAPQGGENLGGPFTISWNASDPDGDPLTYAVLYVRGGTIALPLASGLTNTTFEWNNPALNGGGAGGRIVVMANDGVNEGRAISGEITVSKRAPVVTILSPQNGVSIPAGTETALSGAGSDAEDGYLPSEALSFRSNIDGDFGPGATNPRTLSQGVHTITLTGVDSDGNTAETSISITVGGASDVPVIDRISPSIGAPDATVTLTGRNFASGSIVRFGASTASIVTASSTEIIVHVPAGLPLGDIDVVVSSGGHTSQVFPFIAINGRPLLSSVNPNAGPPGTPVSIHGAEFAPTANENIVRFGGTSATVLSAGLDNIIVTVPSGLPEGNASITVATAGETSNALPFSITSGPPATPVIIDSISPSSGPVGTIVTINGTGFSNALHKNVVGFGGIAVTPVSVSGNSLQAIVPFGLSSGSITVVVSVNHYPSNPLPFTVLPETTPTPPPNGCLPSPANLVAWWPGDGNANDIQNGNNGTLQGSATFAQGKVNQAFSLNPSTSNGSGSDFVSFGNPAALKITGSLTVDAWINTNDFPQGKLIEIVTKWGQNFTCGFPNTDSFILGLDKPGATIRLVGIIHTSNPNQEPSVGGGIITPGQLTHVAMTYDAATGAFAVYVNGAVVNSSIVATGGICTSDLNVMIGSEDSFQGPSRRFSGLIDEVDIFDRALSAGEIQAIFNAGSAGKCQGTITPGPGGVREVQNISTRVVVGKGESVAIGGFIVQGTGAKRVIVRAIGPSLKNFGVTEALEDPSLELFNSSGNPLAFNDDWSSSQQKQEILESTLPPANDLESAIVAVLAPGNHTAVLRGYNDTTGVALVEVYDLLQSAPSRLANISTRGFVGTGGSVLIGGFIVGKQAEFVVRAIGPSLGAAGIAGALSNPVLELYDGQGARFDTNDNWQDNPSSNQVSALGLAPTNALESALIYNLSPGNYTAIVRGNNDGVGIGLIEVYNTTSSP